MQFKKNAVFSALVVLAIDLFTPVVGAELDFFDDQSMRLLECKVEDIARKYASPENTDEFDRQLAEKAANIVKEINEPECLSKLALWAISNYGRGSDCSPHILNIVLYDSIAKIGDIGGKDGESALMYFRQRTAIDGGVTLTFSKALAKCVGENGAKRRNFLNFSIISAGFHPPKSPSYARYSANCSKALWDAWKPPIGLQFSAGQFTQIDMTFSIDSSGKVRIYKTKTYTKGREIDKLVDSAKTALYSCEFEKPVKCGLDEVSATVNFFYSPLRKP